MNFRNHLAAFTFVIVSSAVSGAPDIVLPNSQALHNAIKANNLEGVKEYVTQGGSPNVDGCRALFFAYYGKKFDIAKYLEGAGARVSPRLLTMLYLAEKVMLETVNGRAKIFFMDHQRFPTPAELNSAMKASAEPGDREGSVDHWGNTLIYRVEGGRVIVGSYGADGLPGGNGIAKDIYFDTTEAELDRAANEADPDGKCEK